MLFAHLKFKANNCVQFDFDSLPKYCASNDATLVSKFSLLPKVAVPLCDRFANEGSSLPSDVKKWTLRVELKSDKRIVRLNKSNELVAGKETICDNGNSVDKTGENAEKSGRRVLIDKTKSLLRELAETRANALQPGMTNAGPSSYPAGDTNDAERVAAPRPPTVSTAHRDVRKRKKPTGMEETWKLLDCAYQKAKSQVEKCNDKTAVKSVHGDKKMPLPVQIPLNEHVEADPRLTRSCQEMTNGQQEMDLPLPAWVGLQRQKPIDVIIGVGRETDVAADDGDQHGGVCADVMKSLERNLRLLHVLDKRKFTEVSRELSELQQKIETFLTQQYGTQVI